ncbi:MAG: hypothetical protein UR39_C0002G0107 [Candidatus Woesebacteria bacterium GW2011_GWA1_33_30]|uniref:EamA domain-containing protein n=1 Tax=Candidatus Woesebacteria bacterium GW2011_GWA2_33_28 TaxID=1618561 RepID=A0A0F9ZUS1_9BACT|nr:MAG: hypothetical protein UR38_C0002G0107 [Candidatus Woesebacteria bacterium GW2011_GWA2_33_28]KKP48817.1 MAG: hypothetical protein UR39_C0002G0107 [Candidatus Woesebacteria bacterium GW2011_GWA1_33_30]KKP50090.1 MAG: hypothetical protein UR40_C0002G0107 [Microgenomates group bacterium GW2011_GWC1_33_32]KKP51861.1 MAG: hypothetical protein UR44_C0006G0107 [Candidatus Woesebacteria bacterium GW2011_GWB1_33_38]KKP57680.1 MAG: hypothetical protein UR48_C0012G0008 [Microgenomates group bacteriu
MQITPRVKAYLMLLGVALIWGIAGPVIKLTLNGIPPLLFITYRFLIASIFALPFLLPKLYNLKKNFWLLLLYGFLNSTATLGLLFLGTDKTTLLDMSLLSLLGPILMILFGYFFLHDHVTKREKIGILIAFFGSLVIAVEPITSNDHGPDRLIGNILILGSLLCGAMSGLLTKTLLKKGHEPFFLINLSFVVGFLTTLPFVLFNSSISETLYAIRYTPFPYHLGVVYMAFVSGTLAYYLNAKAQKTIELSEAALFSYIHPAISAVFALLLLGDKITSQLIIGGVIAIVGVGIAEIKKKRYNI